MWSFTVLKKQSTLNTGLKLWFYGKWSEPWYEASLETVKRRCFGVSVSCAPSLTLCQKPEATAAFLFLPYSHHLSLSASLLFLSFLLHVCFLPLVQLFLLLVLIKASPSSFIPWHMEEEGTLMKSSSSSWSMKPTLALTSLTTTDSFCFPSGGWFVN